MRLLIPSAGAASSVSVIKAARGRGHYVLTTDLHKHVPGAMLSHDHVVSGMCYEEPYIGEIIAMCEDHAVDYVIPINDAELPVYVQHREELLKNDITPLMNSDACTLNGHNKEKSWEVCEAAGIRQPERYFHHTSELSPGIMPPPCCFPLIAKPPMGVGGRGQHICRTKKDVYQVVDSLNSRKLDQFLWQAYLEGTEFSVDCWGDPNTHEFVAVPRTRDKIVNGQAVTGTTVDDVDVTGFVRRICQAFGSTNVCCVQVLRARRDGKLYFIEFNPRYGTGVSLSFRAGVDFLYLQSTQVSSRPVRPDQLRYQAGVSMVRFWEERYFENEKGTKLCPPPPITPTSG